MITMTAQQHLNWHFFDKRSNETYELGEKGSVQEILYKKGVLPDPFYGLNEDKYLWIEKESWVLETSFVLTEKDFNAEFISINFGNVDTYATVFINDEEIGKTESSFIRYRFDIKDHVKIGLNHVRLNFSSPINYHRQMYENLAVKFPTPNDVHPSIKVSSMTRKPQFQFGWDWSLRMNTIGLNEPAFIDCYAGNRLLQHTIQTVSIQSDVAKMKLNLIFEQQVDSLQTKIDWNSFPDGKMKVEDTQISYEFEVRNPQLYWPVGYGEPFQYEQSLFIKSSSSERIELNVKFGISEKKLVQQKDEYGTSFELHWNGKRIFCKGGNYIPQDVFLSSVTEERIKKVIDQCVDANFNIIRIWGGGTYLPDYFYQYCADNGILIWQDFMFACALYPGDEDFLSLVKREADFQIPRIGKFPNIALFNGNNEVLISSKYWGFKEKYGIDSATQVQFDLNYKKLFQELLPDRVKTWTNIPYEHTSPLSHWGKDEWYKHGTQHYWGVWHGNDPIEDFARKSGRFNAEYGFQSFPEYSTLLKVSEQKDWNLENPVIKQHQKSYVGNEMILKQTKKLYGVPTDFEDFIYRSQLTQAEAVGIAISSHRLQYPKCTGTIYWQINDCWPVSSWSSIDYYDNWKALHYRVKADFKSLTVLRNVNDAGFDFWLINDEVSTRSGELKYTIFDVTGKKVHTKWIRYSLNQFDKMKIELPKQLKSKSYVIEFEWNDEKRSFILNDQLTLKSKLDTPEFSLIIIDNQNAKLEIQNGQLLKDFWLTSADSNLKIRLKQNFIHILPGKTILEFEFDGNLKAIEQLNCKWR